MKGFKRLFLVVCAMLMGAMYFSEAKAEWFTWSPYNSPDAEEFRIYRSTSSLVCEEAWTFPSYETQFYIDPPSQNGVYFMSMIALRNNNGEEVRSSHSNEIILKYCNGQVCDSYFDLVTGAGFIYLDFDVYPTVSGYMITYLREGDVQETVINNVAGPMFVYDLPNGRYTFNLYAKDAQGRLIQLSNTYPPLVRDILYDPTPPPPYYSIESLGAGSTQTLLVAFEKNDVNVDYYNLNIYSSSTARDQAIYTNAPGDIFANVTVPYGTNFCGSVDGQTYPIVFLRATSVGYNGYESLLQSVGYRLLGDITGTMFHNVDSQNAIVDATDRALLYEDYKKYSIQPYPRRSYDFCSEPELYQMMPFKSYEIADYNLDGLIGTWDYLYLMRTLLGSSGAGK